MSHAYMHAVLLGIYLEVKLLHYSACVCSDTVVIAKEFSKELYQFTDTQSVWVSVFLCVLINTQYSQCFF